MSVRALLQAEAERRGLRRRTGGSEDRLSLTEAFVLVRDMPYARASAWTAEAVIREWRGTCSGKHYVLQQIFQEEGIPCRLYACTQRVTIEDAAGWPAPLRDLLAAAPYVDIHNYLVAETPGGEMVIDATWPLAMRAFGLPSTETFRLGESMPIACRPLLTFPVPEGVNPQDYKDQLLREQFTPEELAHRERVIHFISAALAP